VVKKDLPAWEVVPTTMIAFISSKIRIFSGKILGAVQIPYHRACFAGKFWLISMLSIETCSVKFIQTALFSGDRRLE
jgi:hypothetical protein